MSLVRSFSRFLPVLALLGFGVAYVEQAQAACDPACSSDQTCSWGVCVDNASTSDNQSFAWYGTVGSFFECTYGPDVFINCTNCSATLAPGDSEIVTVRIFGRAQCRKLADDGVTQVAPACTGAGGTCLETDKAPFDVDALYTGILREASTTDTDENGVADSGTYTQTFAENPNGNNWVRTTDDIVGAFTSVDDGTTDYSGFASVCPDNGTAGSHQQCVLRFGLPDGNTNGTTVTTFFPAESPIYVAGQSVSLNEVEVAPGVLARLNWQSRECTKQFEVDPGTDVTTCGHGGSIHPADEMFAVVQNLSIAIDIFPSDSGNLFNRNLAADIPVKIFTSSFNGTIDQTTVKLEGVTTTGCTSSGADLVCDFDRRAVILASSDLQQNPPPPDVTLTLTAKSSTPVVNLSGSDVVHPTVKVVMDLKQGSCPATINPNNGGNEPFRILGGNAAGKVGYILDDTNPTAVDFTYVNEINVSTVKIEGVSTPSATTADPNYPVATDTTNFTAWTASCSPASDGEDDLVFSVKTSDLMDALCPTGCTATSFNAGGGGTTVTVTGRFNNGTPFTGTDKLTINQDYTP